MHNVPVAKRECIAHIAPQGLDIPGGKERTHVQFALTGQWVAAMSKYSPEEIARFRRAAARRYRRVGYR